MKFRIAIAALLTAVALTACDKAENVKQDAVEKTKEVATEIAKSTTDTASEVAKAAEETTAAAAAKAEEMAKAAEEAKAAATAKAEEMAKAAKEVTAAAATKAEEMAKEVEAATAAKAEEMAKAAEVATAAAAAKAEEMAKEVEAAAAAKAEEMAKVAEVAKAAAAAKAEEMAKAAEVATAAAAAKVTESVKTTAAKASMADKTKVGFVYVGPIGDHGWSYQHDQSRLAVEKALGVTTAYVESVPEGADAERVIRQLATSGNNVIFTTSFGYMNPTLKVAKSFPDVKFEHATGYKRAPNLSTYSARFYEGRAILGTIAGKMTKTNIIGYIASFPIPEVIRGIDALTLAARKVNPDVKVKVVWVNTWFDPGKEGDAAKALIDQGADIITQHTDSPAPLQVAEKRGVYGFGQASNMKAFAPKAQLTSIIDNWDAYYIARVKAAMDGTWESTDTWDGIKAGMVEMAPYGDAVPADVREMADTLKASIVDGSFHPFQGPIKNQQGEIVVKEGEVISDGDLAKLNWYVEGVDGTIPK